MIEALDAEKITVSTSAVGLTADKLTAKVNKVFIHFEGTVRYWTSGKAPTSTDGIPTVSTDQLTLERTEAQNLKMIRVGGADVAVHVQYLYDRPN